MPQQSESQVSLLACIREMDCDEIEAFLDAPTEDADGTREVSKAAFDACEKQWKQLTDEPFPFQHKTTKS